MVEKMQLVLGIVKHIQYIIHVLGVYYIRYIFIIMLHVLDIYNLLCNYYIRYIFTMLSPLARALFPLSDDSLLNTLYDDNQRIEPEWYCPIIPMVLVNGAEGIGTGYSTSVPNYDPCEIVANLKRIMNGFEPQGMVNH